MPASRTDRTHVAVDTYAYKLQFLSSSLFLYFSDQLSLPTSICFEPSASALCHLGVDDVVQGDGDGHEESEVVARLHSQDIAVVTCQPPEDTVSSIKTCDKRGQTERAV